MNSATTSLPEASEKALSKRPIEPDRELIEEIDFREIYARLLRGMTQTIGFAAIGLAIGATAYLISGPFTSSTNSMRVVFGFPGASNGEYPDHSKFQPDDLRASDIVENAIKRQGLDATEDSESRVRAGLTVEGIIPPDVVKERDRLRATGQTPSAYIPDEYLVTLTLPHGDTLTSRQRELLLDNIVSAYHEKFERTYSAIPLAFGNAFESLRDADYFDYELILDNEMQSISTYLDQQLDQAKTFRSSTTNLSFNDLKKQTEFFQRVQLSEALGLIRQNGLSKNHSKAMVKIDYYLRALEEREQKAVEEEKVIDDLLAKSQARSENYVLGIKSQAVEPRTQSPMLDQGLIDSLLANDAYNFLVHQALDAGLKVERIHADKMQLLSRRKDLENIGDKDTLDQAALFKQVSDALITLESEYKILISNIRKTHADFSRQQFADAIRISVQPFTDSRYRPVAVAGIMGAIIGFLFGIGLSLLGLYGSAKTETV